MRSPAGRILRVALGAALIAYGFFANGWTVIGLLGFIPVVTGGFNACLIAPLFGYTVLGERKVKAAKIRSAQSPTIADASKIATGKA